MNNTQHTSPEAYSIIAAIMMIGFLLILTTSTLNLVLQEMQDGKGRQNYIKTFAAAEGATELALLEVKNNGYGYDVKRQNLKTLGSTKKDAEISYSFESKTNLYKGSIPSYQTDIIPLFWIDDTGTYSVTKIQLGTSLGNIIWNIIGDSSGISGKGAFNYDSNTVSKVLQNTGMDQNFKIDQKTIEGFLQENPKSYLLLYNPSSSIIKYNLNSEIDTDFFTKPRTTLYSSASLGKYVQNLETILDNTEFLGILQYSIYSGD